MPSVVERLAGLAGSPGLRRWLTLGVLPFALWAYGYRVFTSAVPRGGSHPSRIDGPGVVAYPMSDAGNDFQNALALLAGDGWVNWRVTNRWTVYKPGWGALLAGAAVLTGRDTARMQRLITFVLSAVTPLFYYLVLTLFAGPRGPPVATLATVFFVLYPADRNWWFMREMMTEGPTLLLVLAFCLLAVRLARRPAAAVWAPLLLGGVGGLTGLVRGQARYAVLAVLALAAAAHWRRPRRAVRLAALLGCGFLAVAGPLYLKTSVHLGRPYLGTSYFALVTMLDWTGPGKAIGGSAAAIEGVEGEAARLQAMSAAVRRAARRNLGRDRWLADAVDVVERSLYRPLGKLLKARGGWFLALMVVLTTVGAAAAARRHGVYGLLPLAFGAAYLAPNLLFSFYRPRFGVPVSWLGLAYLAGALIVWLDGRDRATRAEHEGATAGAAAERFPWRPVGVTAAWLAVATGLLLWLDWRPRPDVDVASVLAHPRTRHQLKAAGIEPDAALVAEIEAAVNDDRPSPRVHVGTAHLPIVMQPGQPSLEAGWIGLRPGADLYTTFFSMSPWKEDDDLELVVVAHRGRLWDDLRHGDRVVALLTDERTTPPIRTHLRVRRAAAVFELDW